MWCVVVSPCISMSHQSCLVLLDERCWSHAAAAPLDYQNSFIRRVIATGGFGLQL